MAAPLLRSVTSNFFTKCRFSRLLLSRSMSGDVVLPPSEHGSGMQVTIMNKDQDGGIMIDSYSPVGFLLNNGIRVVGPCVVFPKSVVHWNVADVDDITEEALEPFTLIEPKLDILVIGKGERECKISEKVILYLRKHKINVEVLPTDQACSTFNFLNSERRVCAAAMIPPVYVEQYEDDIIELDQTKDPFTAKVDYHEIGDRLADHLPPGTTVGQMIEEGAELSRTMHKTKRLKRKYQEDPIKKETGHDYVEEPREDESKNIEDDKKQDK